MRKRFYPGLPEFGHYGVTAIGLIASKGGFTSFHVTSETLCRLGEGLAWVRLTDAVSVGS